MINHNKMRDNFILSLLTISIIGFINVVYPILIGYFFQPEIIGKFAIITSWTVLFSIPVVNGISPSIMRFIAASSDNDEIRIEISGMKFIIIYLVIISIPLLILSSSFFSHEYTNIIIIMVLLFLLSFHYLVRKTLQGKEDFIQLFKSELISFFCFLFSFFLVFLVLNFYVLKNQVLILFIPVLMYHLCFLLIYYSRSHSIIRKLFCKSFLQFRSGIDKRILKYALFVGIGSIFGLGTIQFQIIISDIFFSDSEVGILSFWKYLVAPLAFLSISISGFFVSRITRLNKTEPETTINLVNSVNWTLSLILVPIFGVISLVIILFPSVINTLTLNKYQAEIYWAIPVLYIFQSLNGLLATPSLSYIGSSEEFVKFNPFASALFSISTIFSWIILVPSLSIIGFAVGLAIGGLIFNSVIQIYISILTRLKIGNHHFFILFYYFLLVICASLENIIQNGFFLSVFSLLSVLLMLIGVGNLKSVFTN